MRTMRSGKSWIGEHPYVLSYVMIIILILFISINQRNNTDRHFQEQKEAADQRQSDQQTANYNLCVVQADNRVVIRMVIQVATEGSGGRLNLLGVPEFNRLSPDIKAYLTALQNQTSAGNPDGTTLRDRLLEQAPPISCDDQRPPGK